MAKSKEFRNMKVYGQSGYQYQSTPTVMLKGMWLKELGFEEGTPIVVRCQNGRLTITRAEDAGVVFTDDLEHSYMEPPKEGSPQLIILSTFSMTDGRGWVI